MEHNYIFGICFIKSKGLKLWNIFHFFQLRKSKSGIIQRHKFMELEMYLTNSSFIYQLIFMKIYCFIQDKSNYCQRLKKSEGIMSGRYEKDIFKSLGINSVQVIINFHSRRNITYRKSDTFVLSIVPFIIHLKESILKLFKIVCITLERIWIFICLLYERKRKQLYTKKTRTDVFNEIDGQKTFCPHRKKNSSGQ